MMAKHNFYSFLLRNFESYKPLSRPTSVLEVKTSLRARNLGVTFDEHMNFESLIKNVGYSYFQHMMWIRDIRKYITADAAKQLVHAFVTSRLDNGNSLLYDLPSSAIIQF